MEGKILAAQSRKKSAGWEIRSKKAIVAWSTNCKKNPSLRRLRNFSGDHFFPSLLKASSSDIHLFEKVSQKISGRNKKEKKPQLTDLFLTESRG